MKLKVLFMVTFNKITPWHLQQLITFYTCNQVLTLSINEVHTLDFESGFEHHLIKPTKIDELYSHKDPEQQARWHEAIKKVSRDMKNHGVWHKVKHSIIPKGHYCIKFKIKQDSMFCAHLVAYGYSQILVLTSPRFMLW